MDEIPLDELLNCRENRFMNTAFLLAVIDAAERGAWWPESTLGRLWVVFGFGAQLMFGARFLVQWILSERRGESYIPLAFWYLSIGGGIMLLTYALLWKHDPVVAMGQLLGLIVYARNLVLLRRKNPNDGTPCES
jgi:lipid-A-disaccharide synthase-like uncharacterized protein